MKSLTSKFVLCGLFLIVSLAVAGYTIIGIDAYSLKQIHMGDVATVTETVSTVSFKNLTTSTGRLTSAYWDYKGTKVISVVNSGTVTAYIALDSQGIAELTTCTTHCGVVRPGQGKAYDFTTSRIAMRTSTGAGSTYIDWEFTL